MSPQPDPNPPQPPRCKVFTDQNIIPVKRGDIAKDCCGVFVFEEYIGFYKEQFLKNSGLFVTEPLSLLNEARAILIAAAETGQKEVVITVGCHDDEERTKDGADVLCFLVTVQDMGAAALIVDCEEGVDLSKIQKRLLPFAKIPVGFTRFSQPKDENFFKSGTGFYCLPDKEKKQENAGDSFLLQEEIMVSSQRDMHYLTLGFDMSPPQECNGDMGEQIMELEHEGYSVILIEILSHEDLDYFYDNSYMFNLPVCVKALAFSLLEQAARCYGGQLLYVGHESFLEDDLKLLEQKYAAIPL